MFDADRLELPINPVRNAFRTTPTQGISRRTMAMDSGHLRSVAAEATFRHASLPVD